MGDDVGVKLFVVALVEEHREPLARADAEVVAAVAADVERLFEVSFVEVGLALRALLVDALGFDAPLLRRDRLDALTFSLKPVAHVILSRFVRTEVYGAQG